MFIDEQYDCPQVQEQSPVGINDHLIVTQQARKLVTQTAIKLAKQPAKTYTNNISQNESDILPDNYLGQLFTQHFVQAVSQPCINKIPIR